MNGAAHIHALAAGGFVCEIAGESFAEK